jgi:hypothetical protein
MEIQQYFKISKVGRLESGLLKRIPIKSLGTGEGISPLPPPPF